MPDQAAVERLVEQNAVLQGERDAAVAERDRLVAAEAAPADRDPDPRGWRPGVVIDALCHVADEVGGVPKVWSQELGYSVRGLGPIMDKAQSAMAKHGIVVLPDDVEDVAIEMVEVGAQKKIWRHIDTKWHWRIWHRSGAWIPLVTFGESRDGSDKGRNKAQSAAYKYAIVAALSLAEQNDPDATTPPEREHPGSYTGGGGGGSTQAAPPAVMPEGLTKSQQAKWLWEQQQRQKGAPTPTLTVTAPAPAPEEPPVTHASQGQPPALSTLAAAVAEADAEAAQTREELRERIASIETGQPASEPAEAPQTPQDAPPPPAGPEAADPAPEASEANQEPRGYWPCNRCGEVASGRVGELCPVCRKGELFDGRRDDAEPF